MKNKKQTIIEILSGILSLVATTGFWLLGYGTINSSTVWTVSAIAVPVILVAMVVISNIENRYYVRKILTYDLAKKEEVSGDVATVEARLKTSQKSTDRRMALTKAYSLIVCLLMVAAAFLLGASEQDILNDDGGITLLLLPILFLLNQGVIAFILKKSKQSTPYPEHELTEKEFPVLIGLIRDCAKEAQVTERVRAFFIAGTISFYQNSKEILIGLDPIEVALMTESELRAVLYREFIYNSLQSTTRSDSYNGFDGKLTGTVSMIGTKAFMNLAISKTLFALAEYNVIAVKAHGMLSDKAIADRGLEQTYINALAKVSLHSIYTTYEWKATSYDSFAGEKPLENFVHVDLANFRTQLEVYRDRWFLTLEHGLKRYPDSPDTFAMQKRAFGVKDFDVTQTESGTAYAAEQERYLTYADKIVYDSFNVEAYTQSRERAYLARNLLFSRIEKEDSFSFDTDNERIQCAQDYMGYDNKKALTLLNEVLARSSNSLAYFLKGVILAEEYDDDCIQMFKNSAQNTAFFDEAYNHLIRYALKTGKQEVIDEIDKTIGEKKQTADMIDLSNEVERVKLTSPDKSDPINYEAVELIKQYWGDNLIAIYMAEHDGENGIKGKYVALSIKPSKDIESLTKAAEETRELLFRLSDASTTFFLYYDGAPYNKIKKTHDSLMYTSEEKK